MSKFVIKITDSNVWINGKLHTFEHEMNKKDRKDDMNEKAILALANEMGFEPVPLFEEMVDRLNEILNESES